MKEKSTGVKRRKYDASFKEEVLRMVAAGRPASEVAQSLGIGENLVYKWKSRSTASSQQQLVKRTALFACRTSSHCSGASGSWSRSGRF